jgi:hypothetical protein
MDLRPQINYDPTDPAQVDDHDPVLARLRREAPVSELKPGLFYWFTGKPQVISDRFACLDYSVAMGGTVGLR